MDKTTTIYFDLDGTLYDLYGQPMWLERITTVYDPTVYAANTPLVNLPEFHNLLNALVAKGYAIGIISWTAGARDDGTPSPKWYDAAVREIKRDWVKRFLPQVSEVHIVKYGTPKYRVARDPQGILVDDKPEVVGWKGQIIHADNMINDLKGLVN